MRKAEQRNEALLMIIIMILSIIFYGSLFTYLGQYFGQLVYGLDLSWENIDWNNEAQVRYFRLLQFFTSAGVFLFPAITALFIARKKSNLFTGNMFGFKFFGIPKPVHVIWGLILVVLILPMIFQLYDWNKLLVLPESLHWLEMRLLNEENIRNEGLLAILGLNENIDWYVNILLLCVLAAIGEELFFRGVCQDVISYWTNKPYLSIVVTAILFSVMHFQFYGFIPRFVMGLFLGLIMYWSRSIWLVVVMHFSFNFIQLGVYFYFNEFLNDKTSDLEGNMVFIIEIIVTLIFITLFWQFKNRLFLNNGSREQEVEERI